MLLVEGSRAQKRAAQPPVRHADLRFRLRTVSIAGGFLIGLSTLQGEFDYGVPQFQLVYQPILIAFAAGIGHVTARAKLGRGGALGAVAFYLAGFGVLSLIIGPVFGMSTLSFPLYVVEALLVELVAWRMGPNKPLTLGVVAGALIGTVYGKWKAMLRMENGRAVVASPIFLPDDRAIPAKSVPASAHFTRPFVSDKSVLRREARGGAVGLQLPAYALLLAIVAAWLVSLGFGLRRLLRTAGESYPDEGLGVRAGEGAERDVPRHAVGAQA